MQSDRRISKYLECDILRISWKIALSTRCHCFVNARMHCRTKDRFCDIAKHRQSFIVHDYRSFDYRESRIWRSTKVGEGQE